MNIFDLVNSDSEENVAKRLGLAVANDRRSFICPECGNGSGLTGDGIKQSEWQGKLVWHCYRCGGHWSNVDLVALVQGTSPTDVAELVKVLEEVYPEYAAMKKNLPRLSRGSKKKVSPHRKRRKITERPFTRFAKEIRENSWKSEEEVIAG